MDLINVAVLQRAIPHYRLPLLKHLNSLPTINLTILCGEYDIETTTGLKTEDYGDLKVRFIKIWKIRKSILFQQLVNIRKYDVLIMDVSINIFTTPLYILLGKVLGVKIIGWTKGIPQILDKTEQPIKINYKKIIASQCDALLLYGEISRDYYHKIGIRKTPMFVAQNTIDTANIATHYESNKMLAATKRSALQLDQNFVFGYFGKLTPRKKVDEIIRAFKIVKDSRPEAILIIAGGGPSSIDLKKLSNELGLDGSVLFLGRIPAGEEGIMLALFDVFLSFAQAGLGILEAMASKCLIVSTPETYPETELLVNKVNCLLSHDFSIFSYAKTMEEAIDLGERRNILSNKAFEVVMKKATVENMVNAFKLSINKVVNK